MTVSDLIAALQAGIDAGDWRADSPVFTSGESPRLRPCGLVPTANAWAWHAAGHPGWTLAYGTDPAAIPALDIDHAPRVDGPE